jgi:hypothetical protein
MAAELVLQDYLTEEDLVKIMGLKDLHSLRTHRSKNKNSWRHPPFVEVARGKVRYRAEGVRQWMRDLERRQTA